MKMGNAGLWSRREVMTSGAAGFVAAAGLSAAPAKGKVPIGVQLYSVRFECEKDLPGTLAAIAKMGYQGVEFAGYYGRSAAELRTLLDKNGLKCCGTHIGLKSLLGDELARTIEFNRTIGNHYLIVPGLEPEHRSSRGAWLETARIFKEIGDKLRAEGMAVGYHNHNIEFQTMEGEKPWDTFAGNSGAGVVLQVDLGNAIEGGEDPVQLIRKYAGRIATIHLKEHSRSDPKAFVGEGDVPWKQVFELLEKAGAIRWYIVEYEIEGMPAIQSIARCLENLRKMGK